MRRAAKPAVLAGSLVLAAATVLAVPTTANAAGTTVVKKCSAGGFTGYLKFKFSSGSFAPNGKISSISYKIKKGQNAGGNRANVYWTDLGVMPTKKIQTGDNGKQDGRYHKLPRSKYGTGYGDRLFSFVFDKSNASDPRCNKKFRT